MDLAEDLRIGKQCNYEIPLKIRKKWIIFSLQPATFPLWYTKYTNNNEHILNLSCGPDLIIRNLLYLVFLCNTNGAIHVGFAKNNSNDEKI